MEILERPNGKKEGFAPLDNIGFCLLEVNLEGEVYNGYFQTIKYTGGIYIY